MEKNNYHQLELFSQIQKDYRQIKRQVRNNSFFSYIRTYERVIIIIIGFVITGIVSFSLGVEKGKKLVTTPSIKMQDTLGPKIQPITIEKKDSLQNYTVQVASFQNKLEAEKEAKELRKNGLLPLILSKGRYTVLYVGNFSNKDTAQSLLSQLKKRYRDCFIRRL